jgi:outer membrane protein OmpA-like peptidoglycan-associated protein
MENIMDLSSLAFRGDALDRLSSRLHEPRSATQRGIESALPVSIAGLAEHASSKGNAAALLSTLKSGNYPHVEARDFSSVVADPAATDRVVESGSGFLSRIFGNRVGALIDALAVQSGLSRSSASTMLGLATPLVLNSVAKEARTRNLDAGGLSRFLADQEREVSDRLPANFAASLGGTAAAGSGLMAGPFVGRYEPEAAHERTEVIRERPVVHEERRAKSGLGWLLVGLAVLGAIGLLALAFRRTEAPTVAPDLQTRAPEVAVPEAPQVAAPEVNAPELAAPEPTAQVPEVAAPPVAPPEGVAPEPTAAAPEVTTPEAPAAPAPGAEAKRATSDESARATRASGPPMYWILRDNETVPLSAYLAGTDPAPQRFLLEGLTFETGSSELSSNEMLDEAAEALKDSGAKIRIDGHADDQGVAAENQKLSLARAEAVKSYLVEKGVPEDNITTRGLSESRPLATNDTSDGRAENRRVELVVIER